MHFVYFIQSLKDNSYYVGMTENVERRLAQHNNGENKSTKPKTPHRLVYFEAYLSKTIARKRELMLKRSWKTKEEIINRIAVIE